MAKTDASYWRSYHVSCKLNVRAVLFNNALVIQCLRDVFHLDILFRAFELKDHGNVSAIS